MLWYSMFIVVTLCSCLKANPPAKSARDDLMLKHLKLVLEKKCLKNAKNDTYKQVEVALDNIQHCAKRTTSLVQTAAFDMVCNQYRLVGYRCLVDLIKKVEPCLDPQEKYLPNFVLRGYNNTYDHECERGPSRIKDILSSLKTVECKPSVQDMGNMLVLRCLPKLPSLKIISNPDYILQQSAICRDIDIIHECAIDVIQEHCKYEKPVLDPLLVYLNAFLVICIGTPKNKVGA